MHGSPWKRTQTICTLCKAPYCAKCMMIDHGQRLCIDISEAREEGKLSLSSV